MRLPLRKYITPLPREWTTKSILSICSQNLEDLRYISHASIVLSAMGINKLIARDHAYFGGSPIPEAEIWRQWALVLYQQCSWRGDGLVVRSCCFSWMCLSLLPGIFGNKEIILSLKISSQASLHGSTNMYKMLLCRLTESRAIKEHPF